MSGRIPMDEYMKALITSLIDGNMGQIALLKLQIRDYERLLDQHKLKATEGVEPLGNVFQNKGD